MQTGIAVLLIVILTPVLSFGQLYKIEAYAGGGLPDGIPATATGIGLVSAVAVGALGDVYFTLDDFHVVMRLDSSGVLTRVAGTGTAGFSGDNGPATSAQLFSPRGLAINSAGEIYIADYYNHRIRKVAGGLITTVAGNGTQGGAGDGGTATSAQLSWPEHIAVDSGGNLYISQSTGNRVRKVSGGVITNFAGTGEDNYTGDNGPATSATMSGPAGLAADVAGNLFVADTRNNRIRKISGGIITTVAGNGGTGYSGDGGPATSAMLYHPRSIAIDSAGNLYISDEWNARIRKVSGGIITTVAGNGAAGFSGDGGSATAAQMDSPRGIALDHAGNLYIADYPNFRIRKVSGGTINTVAGNGVPCYRGDNGPATSAQVYYPRGVAVDSAGNVHIADEYNSRIRKISNGVITTVVGTGVAGYGGDNGPATQAQLNFPHDVAFDSAGNMYIADSENFRIRKVANGTITTIAGTGAEGYTGDYGPATSAEIGFIYSITLDSAGNLYMADSNRHRIRKVSNGTITTVAGTGVRGSTGDNGPATSARLNDPRGIAVDPAGDLYVVDSGNHRIRKVSGGTITAFAGTGVQGYGGDQGPAASSQLSSPYGANFDSAGNLYVADLGNRRVRKISGGVITTVAGNGTQGYSGDGGSAVNAQVGWLADVAPAASGEIFLSDYLSHRVRVLKPAAVSCNYAISAANLGVAAAGGDFSIAIHTGSDCAWSITGLPAWLTVSGNSQGVGPAVVNLIAENNPGQPRGAQFSAGGISVPVRQFDAAACAGSATCRMLALPHLAFGSEWTTTITAIHAGTTPANYSIRFLGDGGESKGLPFTGGLGSRSSIEETLPAQGLKHYEAEDPGASVQAGRGLFTAESATTLHASFRRRTPANMFYEAAVPASQGYSAFIVPFDATTFTPTSAPMFLGLGIANLNPGETAQVACVARDHEGTPIPGGVLPIPPLPPLGHYSGFNYPALAGYRGTLECTANTLLSAIGLRFLGYEAFSTLPVIVE